MQLVENDNYFWLKLVSNCSKRMIFPLSILSIVFLFACKKKVMNTSCAFLGVFGAQLSRFEEKSDDFSQLWKKLGIHTVKEY